MRRSFNSAPLVTTPSNFSYLNESVASSPTRIPNYFPTAGDGSSITSWTTITPPPSPYFFGCIPKRLVWELIEFIGDSCCPKLFPSESRRRKQADQEWYDFCGTDYAFSEHIPGRHPLQLNIRPDIDKILDQRIIHRSFGFVDHTQHDNPQELAVRRWVAGRRASTIAKWTTQRRPLSTYSWT